MGFWSDVKKIVKIILTIVEFLEEIEKILEEKKVEKGRIEELKRKGEYSNVKVNLIKNGRSIGTRQYKVEDPNRELYEGQVLH